MLIFNTIVEDFSSRKIETYNVFEHARFVRDLYKNTKNIKTKEEFGVVLKSELMYNFWSKCEWETIITSFPTGITVNELNRLNAQYEREKAEYGREPYSLSVNLKTEIKIDVYTQVMNNWDIFLDYTWNNRAELKKLVKDL